ncbi:MAG: glycine/betaine ABC transporter permease [Leifsonia xyli]|nr:MAG: glycine/betaine ABC transporter permease [Leifsonia xyli]
MNFFADAFAYLADPVHWTEQNGILQRLGEHLFVTLLAMLVAVLVAVPIGLAIGHTGRGRTAAIVITGSARAIPTFGLLLFIVLLAGLGVLPVVLVLALLAIPPLLAGVYTGIESVQPEVADAARAVGMSGAQVLGRVEVPLGLPLAIGGLRSAVLQVIATATLAAYVGQGGLGRYLIEGLARRDYVIAIVGAILVAALALLVDGVLAIVQRLVVPRGVSRVTTSASAPSSGRRNPQRTPAQEGEFA